MFYTYVLAYEKEVLAAKQSGDQGMFSYFYTNYIRPLFFSASSFAARFYLALKSSSLGIFRPIPEGCRGKRKTVFCLHQ